MSGTPRIDEARGRWLPPARAWAEAAVLVAVTRLAVLAAVALADAVREGPGPLASWRRWDADIYLKIAEHGYGGPGAEPWSEAFLPGFPLLVRGLAAIGVPLLTAGMLVTTAATLVAVAYLLRLGDAEHPGAGRRAAMYLLLFPTSVFLVAPYTESLFLAGAIAAFHHARRDEWAGVAVAAGVATASRVAGVFVLAGLAVEAWRRGRLRAALPALAIGSLPLAAYVAWLWATRGDPFFLLTAQREGWGRRLVGPVDALRTTLTAWSADLPHALAITWRLEVVAAVVGVAVVVVAIRRRDWGYATFMGPLWVVLLSSTWYYSLPRMLVSMFPVVVYLAHWTGRGRWRHDVVVLTLAPLATVGAIVFTSGAWFF